MKPSSILSVTSGGAFHSPPIIKCLCGALGIAVIKNYAHLALPARLRIWYASLTLSLSLALLLTFGMPFGVT